LPIDETTPPVTKTNLVRLLMSPRSAIGWRVGRAQGGNWNVRVLSESEKSTDVGPTAAAQPDLELGAF
jgi:hypothetical protein